MARRLSRRVLSEYIATQLLDAKTAQTAVQQLAAYLVETGRTKELVLIVRDIQAILADKGVVSGTITTAFALESATKQAIETSVAKELSATKISLAEAVDPEVIGGYKITIPGREIDRTIRRQLTTLKTRFKKV